MMCKYLSVIYENTPYTHTVQFTLYYNVIMRLDYLCFLTTKQFPCSTQPISIYLYIITYCLLVLNLSRCHTFLLFSMLALNQSVYNSSMPYNKCNFSACVNSKLYHLGGMYVTGTLCGSRDWLFSLDFDSCNSGQSLKPLN